MKQRVITAIILCLVLIPFVILGDYFLLALSCLLAYGAGYELLNMFSKKEAGFEKLKYIYPLLSVILVVTNFFVIKKTLDFRVYFYILLLIVVLTFIFCLVNKSLKMSNIGHFLITLFYSGVFVGATTSLRYITSINTVTDAKYLGLWILTYLCVTTMGTDIFANIFGIKFGKHRLCVEISPKKSVEGAVAGSVCATILGSVTLILIEHFYNYSLFNITNGFLNVLLIILLSFLITVVGQIGDLVASKFKREYEIKDYSHIFPGHGGILDRFDSILLTGTFMFIIFLVLGII